MHVIRECNVTSTAYDCYHSFWWWSSQSIRPLRWIRPTDNS
jgi:hypothetical protein